MLLAFQQVTFRNGPVFVAREVDATGTFALPTTTGATAENSILIVSGFAETEFEVQVRVQVQRYIGFANDLRYVADRHLA